VDKVKSFTVSQRPPKPPGGGLNLMILGQSLFLMDKVRLSAAFARARAAHCHPSRQCGHDDRLQRKKQDVLIMSA
jgi:hypothetical protein